MENKKDILVRACLRLSLELESGAMKSLKCFTTRIRTAMKRSLSDFMKVTKKCSLMLLGDSGMALIKDVIAALEEIR